MQKSRGVEETFESLGDTYLKGSRPLDRGPYFDTSATKNVTSLVGKTAHLNCRIKNLGNKTVSNNNCPIRWAMSQVVGDIVNICIDVLAITKKFRIIFRSLKNGIFLFSVENLVINLEISFIMYKNLSRYLLSYIFALNNLLKNATI